jgi:hypothetical protein
MGDNKTGQPRIFVCKKFGKKSGDAGIGRLDNISGVLKTFIGVMIIIAAKINIAQVNLVF